MVLPPYHRSTGVRASLPRAAAVAGARGVQAARWLAPRLRTRLRLLSIAFWHSLTWKHWTDLAAVLFLCTLAVYFHRDAIFGGRIFYERDTWAFYIPLAQRLDAALDQGSLPLWTRAIFGGFPLFADGESGMLYPPNLVLFNLLGPLDAIIWRRVVDSMLAALFMYGFGRALRFRPFAAALAAVAFTYGSFLMAQTHHTNIVESALWLPLVFCAVEMAFRSWGRRRYQWLALGALALGCQTLAVHPQIVLITLFAVGLYLAWRGAVGPMAAPLRVRAVKGAAFLWRLAAAGANVALLASQRATGALVALAIVCGAGLAVSAVQLLPQYELVQYSLRGGGVSYDFATQYALPVGGLLQLLVPGFFQVFPGGWWAPWASWETVVYCGVPVLVLGSVAVVCARTRHTWFFAGLLAVSLIIALGPNAPWNLHRLLWELPGYDSMRAPGRFSLLAVFAAATLAGWGAHWLDLHLAPRLTAGALPVRLPAWRSGWFGLYLALLALLPSTAIAAVLGLHAWVDANPRPVLEALSLWGATADRLDYNGFLSAARRISDAVSLTNPGVATSIALLQGTVALLVLWYGVPRFGQLWQGGLLALVAFDLISFGGAVHPEAPIEQMVQTSGATQYLAQNANGERSFVRRGTPMYDNDRPLASGVRQLDGYSSVAPQRLKEYLAPLADGIDSFPDVLLQAASVRYVVTEAKFTPLPFYQLVSYDPRRPLTQGAIDNAGAHLTLTGEKATGDRVRIIAALRDGATIPQDTPVAELTVTTADGRKETVKLRAGHEVADWAPDRAEVAARMQHKRAEPAFSYRESDPDGRTYPVTVWYSELPLKMRADITSVEYRYVDQRGGLRLYGVAVYDSRTGQVGQFRTKPQYKPVFRDAESVVYQNTAALPRAYVVTRAIERTASNSILADMLERSFDPHEEVLLEDPAQAGFQAGAQSPGRVPALASQRPLFRPAQVSEPSAQDTLVDYDAPESGYLVLTDSYYPGWQAYLDGKVVPVYRANYLFRAVRAPAGKHQVQFRYEPPLLELGLKVSVATLLGLAALVAVPELWAAVRRLALGAALVRRHAGRSPVQPAGVLALLRRRLRNVEDWPGHS